MLLSKTRKSLGSCPNARQFHFLSDFAYGIEHIQKAWLFQQSAPRDDKLVSGACQRLQEKIHRALHRKRVEDCKRSSIERYIGNMSRIAREDLYSVTSTAR